MNAGRVRSPCSRISDEFWAKSARSDGAGRSRQRCSSYDVSISRLCQRLSCRRALETVRSYCGRILHNFPDVKRLRRLWSRADFDNLITILRAFPVCPAGDGGQQRCSPRRCESLPRIFAAITSDPRYQLTWTGARYAGPSEGPFGRTLRSSSAISSSCARKYRRDYWRLKLLVHTHTRSRLSAVGARIAAPTVTLRCARIPREFCDDADMLRWSVPRRAYALWRQFKFKGR